MDASKIMMAHIATEVIVIGGISFFFHKRIAELNTKVAELEKKLEKCEGCTGASEGGITGDQFNQYQQQTTQHINNIYSAIRQIANTINGGAPPLESAPTQPSQNKMKEAQQQMKEAQIRESRMRDMRKKVSFVHSQVSPSDQTPLSSLSLTPENTNGQTKLELIDEEKKEIPDEELDDELEDELRDLSDGSPIDGDENSIKDDENNTSRQETPLEFIPSKGKKLVKKKRETVK
ncbi:MAG: hypothetical protein PHG66_05550 [Candidatus Colwellbacteria bacterium]|nr:hypothetical protein [Candidatus Colwellbacteria bacterium]